MFAARPKGSVTVFVTVRGDGSLVAPLLAADPRDKEHRRCTDAWRRPVRLTCRPRSGPATTFRKPLCRRVFGRKFAQNHLDL